MTSVSHQRIQAPLLVVPAATTRVAPGGAAEREAMRDIAPFCLALVPFSIAIGGAAADAGLSTFQAMFGAVALLAGGAQLAAIDTLSSGGGVALTVLVVALLNLRFVIYGGGVATWFADAGRLRRLLLAVPIVDQSFMICQERFEAEADLDWRQRYYLTATTALIATFVGGQFLAFRLGAALPAGLGLHLAAPLAFAGMLAKAVSNRDATVAAVASAITVVAATALLGPVALPLAAAVGVASSHTVRPTTAETPS